MERHKVMRVLNLPVTQNLKGDRRLSASIPAARQAEGPPAAVHVRKIQIQPIPQDSKYLNITYFGAQSIHIFPTICYLEPQGFTLQDSRSFALPNTKIKNNPGIRQRQIYSGFAEEPLVELPVSTLRLQYSSSWGLLRFCGQGL